MNVLGEVDTRGWEAFTEEATREMDDKQQSKFVRAMALKFIGEVVPRTPVDTGRARSGWTMDRRGPDGSFYKERRRFLGGVEGQIFNGVPYISYLELGSSQQAPSGFVRLTLRELSGEMAKEGERRTEAALRLANAKARAKIGLRQGLGPRDPDGRANLLRR